MQDLPSPLIYISTKLPNNTLIKEKTAPNVMGAVVDMEEALEGDLILAVNFSSLENQLVHRMHQTHNLSELLNSNKL
jgi:hypothetical protein